MKKYNNAVYLECAFFLFQKRITQSTIIGKTGESRNANNPGSAGPHLHLVVRQKRFH